ncbi:ABC-type spermidine/putrescine transport system, ATPase component [Halobacteroides halobius DSM 5150]|uniref:ABC-type quaternary amine transporter n=1 Tax=Halobacteroides halobius (strain ATCC 35273 / DSM 5150 / MD-1) TaxID=748449 RepID=L0KAK2_HALHC|nr:ABC transporter ATP-binding protein [Halobacteroides halobius]AGB41128.1 ABC-type spermidine/putrescine transport system, ATPase component [Halobacteroides halobius DSM 5150]
MVEIKLNNLTKSFADEVVIDGLDLTINSGEITALLGPSGCGKTTTLKIIAGLLAPNQGDLLFNQESVIDIPTESREAVLVFQNYLLFPHLNVAENIAFGLKMRHVSDQKQQVRVKELLDLVNLTGYEQHSPAELSGGQRQRVALARALAINPEVLLLDEPLSNLDANLRGEMQDLIRKIHLKEEMTIVFVTHDREEAMLMADKIAVMNQGQIEQVGSPEELYKQPVTKFVADFFGTANYLSGRLTKESFSFSDGEVAIDNKLAPREEIEAMLRPEFIKLTAKEEAKLTGTIINKRFVGERILYQVDIGKQNLAVTILPPARFNVGDKVGLKIDLDNMWFMEG